LDFELPELDWNLTKQKVEEHLEKYRIFKYLTFEERDTSLTASTEPRYHGQTNQTSDQTGSIAAYNVDEQEKQKSFCDRIERAVSQLTKMEKVLLMPFNGQKLTVLIVLNLPKKVTDEKGKPLTHLASP
jgi:hypothetical protein